MIMDIEIIEKELASVLDRITHGEICPLATILQYRQAMAVYEMLKKSLLFLDATENALRKYGKDKYDAISIIYRRKYNYDASGDATLEMLEAKSDELSALIRARRDFLRTITSIVYDENGIEIKPVTFQLFRNIEVSSISKTK
jgi:hypothetical protein